MEKLTLVQIRAKFESTVHSFSYTVVFFWANNGQKSKVKVSNESTAEQSILRLYSSSEKAFAAAHLQKNSKLYNYNETKEINSNMTPILLLKFCKCIINMAFQLLPVALMSPLRNFPGNQEQVGWLYSQAMVRFYTLVVGRERAVGGSSFFPVIRGGGGGSKGGGRHLAWFREVIFT